MGHISHFLFFFSLSLSFCFLITNADINSLCLNLIPSLGKNSKRRMGRVSDFYDITVRTSLVNDVTIYIFTKSERHKPNYTLTSHYKAILVKRYKFFIIRRKWCHWFDFISLWGRIFAMFRNTLPFLSCECMFMVLILSYSLVYILLYSEY